MITKLPTTESTKTTRNFTLSCTPKFLQTTLLSALFFLLLGVGESWGQSYTETANFASGSGRGFVIFSTWGGASCKNLNTIVPSGATNISVSITMTSIDFDLYVNSGSTCPTTSLYTCRPFLSGTSSETCSGYTNVNCDLNAMIGVRKAANNAGSVTITVTWTAPSVSATPVVSSICTGATSISGTSSEANNTSIEVFSGSTSLGTTTVTSGAWTKSGLTALASGASITAKATASCKSVSAASTAVVVANCTSPVLSATSLSSFSNQCINTTSSAASFNLSGINLTAADITVGPLSGFSFSSNSGGSYTSSITITQSGGTLAATPIYVKFSPTAAQSYSGNIPISGGGATSINVAATATGVNTAATATSGVSSAVTSSTATIAGSYTSGCQSITAYGIEYSTQSGFTNGSGTQVASTNQSSGSFSVGLSGLTASQVYYFKAYANNGTTTVYGTQGTFKTACGAASIPWNEGFETGYSNGSSVAGCWTQTSLTGTATWTANNVSTDYNRSSRTGNYNAYLQWSNEDWLFYPVQLTGGVSYTFSAYARQDMATSADANLTLAYGSSATSASMTTIVGPTGIINGNYQLISGVFNPSTSGVYYMGIKGYMNGNPFYISLDDISVTVTPSCSANPSVFASALTSTSSVTLSWAAASPAPDSGYEIYYSTSNIDPIASSTASTATSAGVLTNSITGLTASTTYYWWVRSVCNSTDKGTWMSGGSFYTAYCSSSTTYTGYYISKVVSTNGLTNISNNTGAMSSGGYGNFTAQSISNYGGASTTISTTIYYGYGTIYAWIDWNNDLDFNDSGEQVLNSGSIYSYTYPHVYNSSFAVPLTASLGNHRMRIRYDYYSGNTSCGEISYGETEDYTFTVVATPTCFKPTALNASGISDTAATLGWTAPSPAPSNGYEYAVTTSSTSPSSGIASASTSVSISGLTQATSYYLHVRSYCGGSDYSAWETSTFQTLVPGDNCSNAINLATLTSPYSSTTTGAANDFTNTCAFGNTSPDLVYYINVPNGATLVIGQTANGYDSENTLYYGGSCPGTTQIACFDDPDVQNITWQNTTGTSQTVYWVQDGFSGATDFGTFTLAWTLTLATPACVSTPVPATASSVCVSTSSTTLSWAAATYATGYDVYFNSGSTATTLVASNQSATTYDVGVLAPGTYAWKVVPLNGSLSPTGCSTWTFTVNPLSVAGTVSANQIICINNVPATITLTGNTGTIQWQQSATGTGSWSAVSTGTGGTTASYTPAALTSTTYYRARVTSGSCTVAISSTVTVTVTPTTAITAQSTAAQSVCNGAGFGSISVTATGTGTLTYQWYSNASASNTGGTSLGTSGQLASYTPSSSTDGTKYYYCVVSGTCGSSTSAVSGAFVVKVLPGQATFSSPVNSCGTATLVALGGDNVVTWYTDAAGINEVTTSGNITVSSTSTSPRSSTLTIVDPTTTTTYYAYTFANGCRSFLNNNVQVETKYTSVFQGDDSTSPTSWFVAENWDCNKIPTANTNVVIPSGLSNYPVITAGDAVANKLTVNGSLTLGSTTVSKSITVTNEVIVSSGGSFVVNSGSNLVQSNNVTNTGNITVKRNSNALNRLDYTLWSSPVMNRDLFAFSSNTITTRFYMYDTPNRMYVNQNVTGTRNSQTQAFPTLTAADKFINGRGYLIRTPNTWADANAPQVYPGEFIGIPNNGNISVTIDDSSQLDENKYNLVGNPYPSAIDIDKFVTANSTNIDGSIYLWRQTYSNQLPSAYCVFNLTGYQSNGDVNAGNVLTQSNNRFIAAGQGFFVKAVGSNSGASIVFNNDMRVTTTQGRFYRTMETEKHRIWLNATNGSGAFSQMLLGYVQDATNGVDSKFDGTSMGDGAIVLSSSLESKQYAIQARALPFDNQDVVPLSFKATTAGNYTFTLAQMDGMFAAGQDVFVKDKELEKIHNLKESAYTFSANAGTFANRFEIVFQATLTDLQANSCGATIANMNSLVYADLINGATGYRFKVVNNTTSAVQTIDRPQHWFAFNMLSAYDYNTPYTISVQVQKDGVWTGYYGATCTVNSPNIAATGVMQINPSQCGATLATLGTVIATTPVAGATGYKFRITNTTANASGTNMVQEITRSNHWFTLGMLSRYSYGSSYTVEVAVKTTGAFTPYGNACTVYSPSAPTLASCGQTVATATTLVRTTAMTLATQYRFQVTRMSTQETITFDTANFWFSFRVNVPGYAAGEQYGVRVAVMTAGAWSPYGDACYITAPIASARTNEEASPSEANLFKPVAYPNPFASEFSIALATPFQDDVTLLVYDLQGRLIEKQTVPVTLIDTIHIGANYQMGDYMLVVSQGSAIESMLLHKE